MGIGSYLYENLKNYVSVPEIPINHKKENIEDNKSKIPKNDI